MALKTNATFAETPDTSFVWWLIGYYVSMKQPVVTSDLIRAYLNAVEPGTIVVQADRYMQEAGMAKYSRALYNMYGKKDAARVFHDWLNDILVNTLGWKRMNTGSSCYKQATNWIYRRDAIFSNPSLGRHSQRWVRLLSNSCRHCSRLPR